MLRTFRVVALFLMTCTSAYGQGTEPKTETYNKLKAMAEEDAQVRVILDKVADSLNLAKVNRKIEYTDSLHFEYLNNYVKKNGWPVANDGAEYAIKLAVHDHEHYDVYIQALKKAAEKGATNRADLELLQDLANDEKRYSDFQKRLKSYKGKYMRFEVSSMLQNKLPASLERIQKLVKAHCTEPRLMGMVYAISCRCERTAKLWMGQAGVSMEHVTGKDILSQLNNEMADYCPQRFYDGCCWSISYIPAEHKYTKLVLYVIWDWRDDKGD